VSRRLAVVPLCVLAAAGCGGGAIRARTGGAGASGTGVSRTGVSAPAPAPRHSPPQPPFAVGVRVVTFVDTSRTLEIPGRPPEPRTLVTVIRYPARGPATRVDIPGAAPARAAGPFPLVVFGHGFAVTPRPYAPLLRAWARAGFVVAAPIFPRENADAPGGPDENDLINQPQDVSFVITRMLAASSDPRSVLAGLISPHRIAVTGQSDGGETALAVAYDRYFLDRRVRAAMILSGAKIPGVGGFDFGRVGRSGSPPLLAVQGTADTINPPSFTHAFFDAAPEPKYLLTLLDAPHLGPYTDEQPQLRIVERVTIAFLERYVEEMRGALARMVAAGDVRGLSTMQADPAAVN
jgi:dienelactone hydrolase